MEKKLKECEKGDDITPFDGTVSFYKIKTILNLNSYPIFVLLSVSLLFGTTVPAPARIFYRPVLARYLSLGSVLFLSDRTAKFVNINK